MRDADRPNRRALGSFDEPGPVGLLSPGNPRFDPLPTTSIFTWVFSLVCDLRHSAPAIPPDYRNVISAVHGVRQGLAEFFIVEREGLLGNSSSKSSRGHKNIARFVAFRVADMESHRPSPQCGSAMLYIAGLPAFRSGGRNAEIRPATAVNKPGALNLEAGLDGCPRDRSTRCIGMLRLD